MRYTTSAAKMWGIDKIDVGGGTLLTAYRARFVAHELLRGHSAADSENLPEPYWMRKST